MKIEPANNVSGEINLPGDKSISHRAAIFSAMANGESKIENFSSAADCASTLDCLENLGVEIRRDGTTVFIQGVGKNGFQKPVRDLDCGNSGTTVRLLAGVLAGQNFESVLTGDESLSDSPDEARDYAARKNGRENRIGKQLSADENLRAKIRFDQSNTKCPLPAHRSNRAFCSPD